MALPLWLMHWRGRRRGALEHIPFVGGWTDSRDFPTPAGRSLSASGIRERVSHD